VWGSALAVRLIAVSLLPLSDLASSTKQNTKSCVSTEAQFQPFSRQLVLDQTRSKGIGKSANTYVVDLRILDKAVGGLRTNGAHDGNRLVETREVGPHIGSQARFQRAR
jgi:exo-beta-1,3-glucanase (GH17 family)